MYWGGVGTWIEHNFSPPTWSRYRGSSSPSKLDMATDISEGFMMQALPGRRRRRRRRGGEEEEEEGRRREGGREGRGSGRTYIYIYDKVSVKRDLWPPYATFPGAA